MPRPPHVMTIAWTLPPGDAPLRHRVADLVVEQIKAGRLRPGDLLPPTRVLASELGVSRSAALAAYDELLAAGFIVSRAGSGTVVAEHADRAALGGAKTHVRIGLGDMDDARPATQRGIRWDLSSGRPDVALIDPVAWRRAWTPARTMDQPSLLTYVPEHCQLRSALASHLRRTRGVVVEPDAILIVPGIASSLRLLAEVLGLAKATMAVEDPGYIEAVPLLRAAGACLRPIPVDSDGLDPALLRPRDRAVYITPAHQYPLGGRMPVDRRVDLVNWARRNDAVIIEDDYDGEFRYDVSPLPALHSLDGAPDRVVYLGTASKLISPAMRLAWVLPPPWLFPRLKAALEQSSIVVNTPSGNAMANLLTSGALVSHHARSTRMYAARRAALVSALARHLPGHELAGIDAGLHLVIRLPDGIDDVALVTALGRKGIALRPLSEFCLDVTMSGLMLGYARLPETQAEPLARVLADTVVRFTAAA